jgi:superfamily II DNA or RNA helicase
MKNNLSLFPHQEEALEFLQRKLASMLCLPTGAGKTLISLCRLKQLKQENKVKKCLWVTIPSITSQVNDDNQFFFKEPLDIVDVSNLTPKKRIQIYENFGDEVLVINYHKLLNDYKHILKLVNKDWLLVADEATFVKNPKSKIHSAFKNVSKRMTYKILVTATPIMNSLMDLLNLAKLIDFPMELESFKVNFCNYQMQRIKPIRIRGRVVNQVPVLVGYKNVPQFMELVSDYLFFKSKRDIMGSIPVGISTHHIPKSDGHKIAVDLLDDPVSIARLEIATTAPALIIRKKRKLPTKFTFVSEFIENNCDDKVMIYTPYKSIANLLQKYFHKYTDYKALTINSDTTDTQMVKKQFIENDEYKIIIGTDTIAQGFDGLQKVSSTLIFLNLPFTIGQYQQVVGRLYRSGQKDMVNIVIPIIPDSVDNTKWIHLHSTASLMYKHNDSKLVDLELFDEHLLKEVSALYNEEWVKKDIMKKYKKQHIKD